MVIMRVELTSRPASCSNGDALDLVLASKCAFESPSAQRALSTPARRERHNRRHSSTCPAAVSQIRGKMQSIKYMERPSCCWCSVHYFPSRRAVYPASKKSTSKQV